jgi:hypothetical protein
MTAPTPPNNTTGRGLFGREKQFFSNIPESRLGTGTGVYFVLGNIGNYCSRDKIPVAIDFKRYYRLDICCSFAALIVAANVIIKVYLDGENYQVRYRVGKLLGEFRIGLFLCRYLTAEP